LKKAELAILGQSPESQKPLNPVAHVVGVGLSPGATCTSGHRSM
jgi:hypothetical protein